MTRRTPTGAYPLALALLLSTSSLAAAQQVVTGTLQPLSGSTVTGTATVTVQGDPAPITVNLTGLTPGATRVMGRARRRRPSRQEQAQTVLG